ncbi:hypothetical protein ILYODFUR_010301 [Ilyodon furcidens]|uniref:Uncharacterized protein n=1 Tax=Ilyodon furcidens TaxID=33524 RepID=A0ABV0TTH3_9TELE
MFCRRTAPRSHGGHSAAKPPPTAASPASFLTPHTSSENPPAAFGDEKECSGTKQGGGAARTVLLTIQKPQPVCSLAPTSLPSPFPATFSPSLDAAPIQSLFAVGGDRLI